MDAEGLCKLCQDGADCVQGTSVASMPLAAGIWRLDDSSEDLLSCPFKSACLGTQRGAQRLLANASSTSGNNVSSRLGARALCLPGNGGPLCAVCDPGYARTSKAGACERCGSVGAAWGTMLLYLLGLGAAVAGLVVVNRKAPESALRPMVNAVQQMTVTAPCTSA